MGRGQEVPVAPSARWHQLLHSQPHTTPATCFCRPSAPPLLSPHATGVPLPGTAPTGVLSTLGRLSPTTPASPGLTRVTGGRAAFLGRPLSWSWMVLESPGLSRCPWASSSTVACDLAQEATGKQPGGPRPEWPSAATRPPEAPGSFEPLPHTDPAGGSKDVGGLFHIKTAKHLKET